MDARDWSSAERARVLIERGGATPEIFRAALASVPPLDRDAWVNAAFGIDELPDDGPALPPGCVPYLPCAVDAVLRVVDQVPVRASDVFVDVGSGAGRTAALVHLLTGAGVVGIEIQPELVRAARDLAARLRLPHVSFVEGDAAQLCRYMMVGSVFFLNCPFGGPRLARVLDDLEPIARTKRLRVCAVDLPLPPRPWLAPETVPWGTADPTIFATTS